MVTTLHLTQSTFCISFCIYLLLRECGKYFCIFLFCFFNNTLLNKNLFTYKEKVGIFLSMLHFICTYLNFPTCKYLLVVQSWALCKCFFFFQFPQTFSKLVELLLRSLFLSYLPADPVPFFLFYSFWLIYFPLVELHYSSKPKIVCSSVCSFPYLSIHCFPVLTSMSILITVTTPVLVTPFIRWL